MYRSLQCCLALLMLWVSTCLVGCIDDDHLLTYKVTGKVVFPDGSPLKGGWIILESPKEGLAARGVIDADGTFQVGTYSQSDGAVAGKQLVAITPATPDGYDPDRGVAPPTIHQRLMHMDTSGLEIEVKPGGENHIKITVERPDR